MAARKDVELVIRAKNEATKAFDAIAASVKALTQETKDAQAGAGKTNGAIQQLQGALAGLDKALGGVSIGKKLAGELEAASSAIERLKTRAGGIEAEIADLGKKSAEAATSAAALATKSGELSAALKGQEQTVAKTKAQHAELTKALREATAERDRQITAEKAANDAIGKQSERVNAAHEKYRRLKDQIEATEAPTAKLVQSFERAATTLDKQNTKLDQQFEKQRQVKTALEAAGAAVETYDAKVKATSAALETQKRALADVSVNAKNAEIATANAAKNQGELAKSAERAAGSLKGQQAAIHTAETELRALTAASATATNEQDKLAGTLRRGLLKAFGDQRKAVADARTEYQAAQAATQKLAREIASVEEPTAKMVAALERSRAAVRDNKAAEEAQVVALQNMRAVLRAAGGDYDLLVAAVQKFSNIQTTAGAAADKSAASAKVAGAAVKTLAGESSKASDANASNARTTGAAGDAAAGAARKQGLFNEALKNLFGDGRQAMSIVSRLRAEILALTASYLGIGAAVGGIKSMIAAYQGLEAATSRLRVAFGKSGENAVANELDFVRRQANRLGIDLNTLAGEYSKFAISTQGTSLEGEKTRKIFVAVAQAARVQKLSIEDTKGVFVALSQIASKGTVSMEELRQQLGDRLPGALQLMAQAANRTEAELVKMIEQGQLSADILDKFADKLNERFGSSLEASLQTLTTEIGRFQNAATQAFIQIAESGGADGLKNLLAEITRFFKSPDGEAFFRRLGGAIKGVFDGLAFLAANIKVVGAVLAGFIGLRVAGFFIAVGAAVKGLLVSLGILRGAAAPAAMAALTGVGTAAAGATASVGGLRVALSALGGPIGLAVGVISAALAAYALTADDATEKSVKAKQATDDLLDAAQRARDKGKTGLDFGQQYDFQNEVKQKEAVKTITAALNESIDAAAKARGALADFGNAEYGFSTQHRELETLIAQFNNGELKADEFAKKVKELAEASKSEDFVKLADAALKQADAVVQADNSVKRYEAQLRLAAGAATEADEKLIGLKTQVENAKAAMEAATDAFYKYADALGDIKKAIPSLRAQQDELEEIEGLYKKIAAAARLANPQRKTGDALPTDLADIQRQGEIEIRAKFAEGNFKTQFEKGRDTEEGQRLGELVETMAKFAQSNGIENKDLLAAFSSLTNGTLKLSDDQARAFGTDAAKPQAEQLKAVFAKLTSNGLEANQGVDKLAEILNKIANTIPEALKASQDAARGNVAYGGQSFDLSGVQDGVAATVKILKVFEGFTPDAKYDENAYRAGYGSDTTTLSDGTIKKITEGMKVTREDSDRDLARRIGEFQQTIVSQIGEDKFKSFDPTQQGVLSSVAYNYGRLPDRIVAAIKSGGGTPEITAALRALGTDGPFRPDGRPVNQSRRNREADLFSGSAGTGASKNDVAQANALNDVYKERVKDGEKVAKAEAAAAERAQRFHDSEAARLEIAEKRAIAGKQATLEETIQLEIDKRQEEARKAGTKLTDEEIAAITRATTLKYEEAKATRDAKDAKKEETAQQQEANKANALAATLAQQIATLRKQEVTQNRLGDTEGAEATRQKIADLQAKFEEAAASAKKLNDEIGGVGADTANLKLEGLNQKVLTLKGSLSALGLDVKQVAEAFGNNLVSAFDTFAQDVAAGKNIFEAARNAFLKFAADFLKQIAQMIIKQAVFNAIQSVTGNLGLGTLGLVKHSGGKVGTGNRTRRVSPLWFQNAQRYHGGGIAGLKPNEVPTILERGEEVLTKDDPRHIGNAQSVSPGAAPEVSLQVVNTIDSGEFVSKGLGTKVGQKSILNFIQDNAGAVRKAMEG